ncbi:MAG: AMP-binding protein [Myxococcales bacterium]|jgi:acyl-CoA synthetase (AMP-forming)/AMP-acid ligase II/acyl carrier protein|nr:AMP-binding protein [Myxococcales bacterium]
MRAQAQGAPGGNSPEATLVEVLCRRASDQAERAAYTFLHDGEDAAETITYGALDARARRVAVALAHRDGTRAPALVLCAPGPDFVAAFLGCLYAGVVAVPVPPPEGRDLAGSAARLRRVAADAGARLVLTTRSLSRVLAPGGAADAAAPPAAVIVDDLAAGSEAAWRPSAAAATDVAFLQYTSGSTAAPRGVMVTHANLLAHGACVAAVLALDADAVAVSWLPAYHDMGLIGTLLIPLQIGFRSVQMSPLAFLERPGRWLRAITRYRGTLSPAPNFAYDLAVRRTSAEERRTFALGTWRAAMNGAEPVRAETCERFAAAFAPCGFRRQAFVPCYGLAEATLMVTGGPVGRGPVRLAVDGAALAAGRVAVVPAARGGARVLIASGQPVPGVTVRIVEPGSGAPVPPDAIGEISVAGPTVAAGYWRRPEESAGVFAAPGDEARSLRTGDLGFLRDGALFVTGRYKDLIVVRGRNHHPHDLEDAAAAAHPALRPGGGAAFACSGADGEAVVMVHEVEDDDGAAWAAAAAAIRDAVARIHGLTVARVVLIAPRALPKTTSGKVRRNACRAALAAARLPVRYDTAAVTGAAAIEACLCELVAEVRGLSRAAVRRDAPLAALGVDSAEAAHVAAQLEARLGRRVPLAVLLEQPTIAAVAAALGEVQA